MQASSLYRVDLRGWLPGQPVRPVCALEFGALAGALNGSCLLSPARFLLADSVSCLIWHVDVGTDLDDLTVGVWLQHPSMNVDPSSAVVPPQPGVNGVRYAAASRYVYYTSTAQKLFMRVPVDPATLDPAGVPELVASGTMPDDFCLDENAGVAYLMTHRQNTVDRVSLEPGGNKSRLVVLGDPFDERLIGPTSAAWGRDSGDYGRVAYITTDGGLMAPPPGGPRRSRLLRLELPG